MGLALLHLVVTVLQPPMFEIRNDYVRVSYDALKGVWGIAGADGRVGIGDSALVVRFPGKEVRSSDACQRQAKEERGRDNLGEYVRLAVSHTGLPHLKEMIWSATVRPESRYAAVHVAVRLAEGAPGPVQSIEVMGVSGGANLRFGSTPTQWMRFADSGGQGGAGVAPFFTEEKAAHSAPATLAIYDAAAQRTLLVGWLSWISSNPSIQLSATKGDGLTHAAAQCVYHGGAASAGQVVATEPLLIGFEPDPVAALEQYGREVQVVNNPPIRRDTVMGWLSWYCSRLKMTEQFVLDNGKVIAEEFRAYGIDTMQVDHGWEYKDIVGNWVANERFPHGMKWLGDELQKMGLKLGIWMAVSRVSEHAPFFTEHPDAHIQKADGQPWAFTEKWFWPPHGRVFNLDPTHPAAQEHYRKSLQGLMDAGCRYYKVDFIGSAGQAAGVFHDANRPRGNPMARYEMQLIREAIGPESWLRYCSAPSNVYCGIVNIGGATMDVGNAYGNWTHLEKYHQQLASVWYKHRTFWHNEPDALIVGDPNETMSEARMRCAWLVMSGGVVALGDDLTKIGPDRMALIPKCLPPYDVAARPLDLFERVPSRLWDLHVKTDWDDYHVVAFFNFDEKEQEIGVPLSRLGLRQNQCVAWEFWTECPVEVKKGEVRRRVPGRDCRIVVIRPELDHPQVLATDMHLTMGGVELSAVKWDKPSATLSGVAHRAPGSKGRVFLYVPDGWQVTTGASKAADSTAAVEVQFAGRDAEWAVRFAKR